MIKLALCQEIPFQDLERYFDLGVYVAQRKWNGIRAIMTFNKIGETWEHRLFNKSGIEITEYYPDLVREMNDIKTGNNTVLDGEIVAFRDKEQNYESFNKVIKRDKKIHTLFECLETPVYFKAFNMPYWNGNRFQNYQEEYKQMIKTLGYKSLFIHTVPFYTNIKSTWSDCIKYDWEGIVLKRKDRAYMGTRNWNWIKVKPHYIERFEVYGYIHNNEGFKSLLLKNKDGENIGKCGQGFTDESRTLMEEYVINESTRDFENWSSVVPFDVMVKHYGFTEDGMIRNAVFLERIEK